MYKLVPAPNGMMCKEDPGEPNVGKPRWSVNAIEARMVSELCRGLEVLEIGTGLGVSTKEIAKRARFVYTVDVDQWVEKTIAPTLPTNVSFYKDTRYIRVGLDAAFIDGFHSFEQCKKDIIEARRIVKQDGLFIFHDMKISGVMRAVMNSGLKVVYIETYAGMAVGWNG